MKTDFHVSETKKGLTVKLWRGERMCLLGMDVKQPEPDFVGFAIERKDPGSKQFEVLPNRIAFEYPAQGDKAVDGSRKYPSTEAPFQKFRWIDFPFEVKSGIYTYRVTKMHMPEDNVLKKGLSITLSLSLEPVTYAGFLDIGFTRNFASSQAFIDKMGGPENINAAGERVIPDNGDKGLDFKKLTKPKDLYEWLGFEAHKLLFDLLDEAVNDSNVTVDMLAYDFNEPDMLKRMVRLKKRLRLIMDDSEEIKTKTNKDGTKTKVRDGHVMPDSPESRAAAKISQSAGAANVVRTHFKNLQHHKVIILRREGVPYKVLCGSTNFTFRGLYIQANNLLVFDNAAVAGLYGRMFDSVFKDPAGFSKTELAQKWHAISTPEMPPMQVCFSPHGNTDLSLRPVQGAIEQASSSVLYAVAFLNQMGGTGLTRQEFDRLMQRPVFSYGIANTGAKTSDGTGNLEVHKPDGSIGLVDFEFLARNAPEPFKSEWQGGKGINIHHKFVVTDFNLPTAKVFTGSSNLSPAGEAQNGDHLIMIEDQRVATAYAIEALRMFDHLHFRTIMREKERAGTGKKKAKGGTKAAAAGTYVIKLRKPTRISGEKAEWFDSAYVKGSQKEKDRLLFSGA